MKIKILMIFVLSSLLVTGCEFSKSNKVNLHDYINLVISKSKNNKKIYIECKNEINEVLSTKEGINDKQLLLVIEAFNFCINDKRLDILENNQKESKCQEH